MRPRARSYSFALALLLLVFALTAPDGYAAKKTKEEAAKQPASVAVERWLVLGPVSHPMPVFHDADKGGFDLKKLMKEAILPHASPSPGAGTPLEWYTGETINWQEHPADEDGSLALKAPTEGLPAVAWTAAWIAVERWSSYELELLGTHPRRAWIDGAPIASGGMAGSDKKDKVKGTAKLTTGKHLLLVQTLLDPEIEKEWTVGAAFSGGDGDEEPRLDLSLSPERPVSLTDILDSPQITSLSAAPDGSHVAVTVRRIVPGTDDGESWVEIRRATDGALVESWRGALGAREVSWSPDGRYIAYITEAPGKAKDKGKGSSLYLYEREAGRVIPLLESIEELGSYLWSPTGRAIVYSTTVKAEKDKRGVKLLEGVMDRWADYRDKQYLHLVGVPGGVRRQLTAGDLSSAAVAFAPDGKRLLLTRRIEVLEQRPYGRTELWELDLQTFEATRLRDFLWFNGAKYSPDGSRLLIAADATAFGDIGVDLPEGVVPNSYDGQLYLWDPQTDHAEAITRTFDPAVGSAAWSRSDGRIYFAAEDEEFVRLYRYDPADGSFAVLPTGYDRLRRWDLAQNAPLVMGLASSPWVPQSLVSVDLSSGRAQTLAHPADDWFADLRPGTVEERSFTASSGREIPGRVYLPQGFDPERRYPAIVYYYGGTAPVTREFGGRYPKEWWAANGYVVYVLQPSGATGFGQEKSATHVNDWGKVTTQEIVEGTRAFLEAHPYVDPERVGCIGASYGGFMTMLLSTQTELFAAAVSHAGISSLASYWGEGYWGALYSAVATAESFPWNRKDIYVDQSPLFRADQARVPILLTHGTADTNVPVGESDQFYVALKLLGKDVEYLQVEGQNHFIMEHGKRAVWSSSIVAWFDRWLKEQPEWWNELYPSSRKEKEGQPAD